MKNKNAPLWKPSSHRIHNSNLTSFMADVNSRFGTNLSSFEGLHNWSITPIQDFWRAVWDHCGLIASQKGKREVHFPHGVFKPQFFPDAELNYAENLLRPRPAETPVLIFWGDDQDQKYHAAYFERFKNVWCQGDYVEHTSHGGFIVYGRSDTLLNPGGVRIGTAEIYRQIDQIPEVLESLVVSQDWQEDIRVVLFVKLKEGLILASTLIDLIKQKIRTNTFPRHAPAKILQISDIPRTKSGKIVELAVREIIHGFPVKNTLSLANPEALNLYKDIKELQED